jgi:hypothetical protein
MLLQKYSLRVAPIDTSRSQQGSGSLILKPSIELVSAVEPWSQVFILNDDPFIPFVLSVWEALAPVRCMHARQQIHIGTHRNTLTKSPIRAPLCVHGIIHGICGLLGMLKASEGRPPRQLNVLESRG